MTNKTPSPSTESRPLVSILVSRYNGAAFLREALDSIVAQIYSNLEIILLDDASSDDTPAIAAEYEGKITYVRRPNNLGIYDIENVGITQARGSLIATYHADDIYLSTFVEGQVAYFQAHPEVGAVFCSDIFVDEESWEYGHLSLAQDVRGEQPLNYQVVLNALLKYKTDSWSVRAQ